MKPPTACTQISQPQNTFTIGHHDSAHIRLWPIPNDIIDVALVVDGDKETSRATIDQAELLARQTHGGRVHNRHHLFHILGEQAEEEAFISVLEKRK